MFTSRTFKALLLLAAPLLCLHADARAQSGRKSPTPKTIPGMRPAPAPTPVDDTRYEKVRVVVAEGMGNFVKVLKIAGQKLAKLTGLLPDAAVSELQRHLAEDFRVRDIFYTYGLYVILEKQTEAPASQVQTSAR